MNRVKSTDKQFLSNKDGSSRIQKLFTAVGQILVLAAVLLSATSTVYGRSSKFTLVAEGGKGEKAWKLYRGNRIKDVKDLKWLKKQGVTRVVALENWNHKMLMKAAKKIGIEYMPRFMARGNPGEMGRKRFGENVSDDIAKPGHVTYVYCTYGVHRTGGTIGRFRAEQGWGCDAIMKEARKFGFRKSHYKKYSQLLDWVRKRCKKNDVDASSGKKSDKKK